MAEAPRPVWPQDHAPLLTTWYMRSIFMTDKVPPSFLARVSLVRSLTKKKDLRERRSSTLDSLPLLAGDPTSMLTVSAASSWELGEEMLFHGVPGRLK